MLYKSRDAYIIFLDTAAANIHYFLMGYIDYAERAADDLINGTVIPREINTPEKLQLIKLIALTLLLQGKARVFNRFKSEYTKDELLNELETSVKQRAIPGVGEKTLEASIGEVSSRIPDHFTQPIAVIIKQLIHDLPTISDNNKQAEAKSQCIKCIREELEKKYKEIVAGNSYKFSIGLKEIVNKSHDKLSSVMLFLASEEDTLRLFVGNTVREIYRFRKNNGISSPNILFFLDEADLFMPISSEPKTATYQSLKACETIARRGRKFGMGLGFATQRATYLNTNTIAQIGTYFVGKLPRATDRSTVLSAFGVDESAFANPSTFSSGDWLIMSHTALGRKIPVIVRAENANERIANFLEKTQKEIEQIKKIAILMVDKESEDMTSIVKDITTDDVTMYYPADPEPLEPKDSIHPPEIQKSDDVQKTTIETHPTISSSIDPENYVREKYVGFLI